MTKKKTRFYLMPNVIHLLGLKPIEFLLYSAIKRITGEKGVCTCSIETMSTMTGICASAIKLARKKLSQPFDLIKQPLIEVKTYYKGRKRVSEIRCVPIWTINDELLNKKNKKSKPITSETLEH